MSSSDDRLSMVLIAASVGLLVIAPYIVVVAFPTRATWHVGVTFMLLLAYVALSGTSTPAMLLLMRVLSSHPEVWTSPVGRCALVLYRIWMPGAVIGIPLVLGVLLSLVPQLILVYCGICGIGSAPAALLLALAPRVIVDPAAKLQIARYARMLAMGIVAAIALGLCGILTT